MKRHQYEVSVDWTGNDGEGTRTYRSYRRDFSFAAPGKPQMAGSSDSAFRGDASRYNPEDMLVAALSSCHMLAYLHLCAINNIAVVAYSDKATGVMEERADGSGVFTRVQLNPRVTVSLESDTAQAEALHQKAHELCFIANSVNFPVDALPTITRVETGV